MINISLTLPNGGQTTVSDLKEKVKQSIFDQAILDGEEITLDDVSLPIICVTKDNKVSMMARSEFTVDCLSSGFKFVALERDEHVKEINKLVVIELMITQ